MPQLPIYMNPALRYGATKEEIMEVYQLTSVLGMHTCTMGVPVLLDELRKLRLIRRVDLCELPSLARRMI